MSYVCAELSIQCEFSNSVSYIARQDTAGVCGDGDTDAAEGLAPGVAPVAEAA